MVTSSSFNAVRLETDGRKRDAEPSEPGAVTRSGRTMKPPERYGFSDIEY